MTTDTLSDAALEKRALRYFSDTLGFSKGQIFDDEVAHLARLLRAVRDEALSTLDKYIKLGREVVMSGVEHDGPTNSYVTLQIDRETLNELTAMVDPEFVATLLSTPPDGPVKED